MDIRDLRSICPSYRQTCEYAPLLKTCGIMNTIPCVTHLALTEGVVNIMH